MWKFVHKSYRACTGFTKLALLVFAFNTVVEFERVEAAQYDSATWQPTTAVTVLGNAACSALPGGCAAVFGYDNVMWYGGTCNGVADDSGAINAAAAASKVAQRYHVRFPDRPFECSTVAEITTPSNSNGFRWDWPVSPAVYDGGTTPDGVMFHLNTNCGGGGGAGAGGSCWSSLHNIGFDVNGNADVTFIGFNCLGDLATTGTSCIGNSFNTVSAVEPQPRVNLIGGSSASIVGSFCCSPMQGTGVTGLATPSTGPHTTANNLITLKSADVVRCNEDIVCLTANISDANTTLSFESAANQCGDVVGVLAGNVNLRLAGRFENSVTGTGVSGFCEAHSPNIEVPGTGWTIEGQIINNGGAALYFDKQYGDFTFEGLLAHNGQDAAGDGQSELVFNGATGFAHTGVNLFLSGGQAFYTPPLYFAQWENASAFDATARINVFGSLGSTAYSLQRDLVTAEAASYGIVWAQGEPAQYVAPMTGGTQILLGNTSSGAHVYQLLATGSSSDGGAGNFNLCDTTGGNCNLLSSYGHFRLPSNGQFEFSGTGDPNAADTAHIFRQANFLLANNGAMLNGGIHFTVTGGTFVSGSATGGTFTSAAVALNAVVTMNGANGITAPNGWDCHATDLTTGADALLIKQTASTATTATFGGTTVIGDTISFNCQPY